MNRNEAQRLVTEIEGLDSRGWAAFDAHPRRLDFELEWFRAKCVADFWTYLWHFGYFNNRKHYDPIEHRKMADWLQDWTVTVHGERVPVQTKVLATMRGGRKTQLGSILYTVWELLGDQGLRYLFRSYTDGKAQEIIRAIASKIQNPQHIEVFPWLRPAYKQNGQSILWSISDGQLLVDRDDLDVRSPTIEAIGMKKDPTGGHFYRGRYDDWEVQANTESDEMRPDILNKWKSDKSLYEAGRQILLTGTPWWPGLLMDSAINGKNEFADMLYDKYVLPATYKAFDTSWEGESPRLLEDRVTVVTGEHVFPVSEDDLRHCQVRMVFWSEQRKDTIIELREVEWNNTNTFRVNRPYPFILGQPISWHIGGDKPSLPTIHTMDGVDERSDDESVLARKSLPQELYEQGPRIYSMQMQLTAKDKATQILSSEDVRLVDWSDLPKGNAYCFRAIDMATSKKTKDNTAMITALVHETGWYITHIYVNNTVTITGALFELFAGYIRAEEAGHPIMTHFMEEASLEHVMREFLVPAEQDPYGFFSRIPEYAKRAETLFNLPGKQRGAMFLARKSISRGGQESKDSRIVGTQPAYQQGRIHMVKGIANAEVFLGELDDFRVGDKNCRRDLLDNITDLIREAYSPRIAFVDTAQNELDRRRLLDRHKLPRRAGRTGWI